MSLKAMTSLARVTRRRSARAPTCGLPKRVPAHPDCIVVWFMILLLIWADRCIGLIARRPRCKNCDLGLHRFAEPLVAVGQVLERPVDRADRVGRRKDRQRETVTLFLKFPERRLAAGKNRGRRSFSIAQRIRNAVRRQRIAEETGIADQHPAGTMRLPKSAG